MDDTQIQHFIHPKLGREVTAVAGHYVFNQEVRLAYHGREVLYFVGYAVLDSSCCGVGGCAYVFVPGFIRQWKYSKKRDDCFVSKVEPIGEPSMRAEIRKLIQERESVSQVTFG